LFPLIALVRLNKQRFLSKARLIANICAKLGNY
ncbi:hypothetical protein T02_12703, partial [Trichinella nativa]